MVTFNSEVMYWPGRPCKNGHDSPYYKRGNHCVECRRVVCLSWRNSNKEKDRENQRRWANANRERRRALARARYNRNPLIREKHRAWKKAHQHIFTALQVKREASKKMRTPKWADHAMIKWLYGCAQIFTRETGIKHHVDHIVPLNGKNVCGFHVHRNMTIITASENMKKKNKWEGEWEFRSR